MGLLRDFVLILFGWILGKKRNIYHAGAFLFYLGVIVYFVLALYIVVRFMVMLCLLPFKFLFAVLRRMWP